MIVRSSSDLLPQHVPLLDWWSSNHRRLPWREDGVTAYQLIVTEMLLWKTRAEMVDGVWARFFDSFPTVRSLADADPKKVQGIIASLGLKKRASMLVSMAKSIVSKFDGEVPSDRGELMSMEGVGDYVSSAVLSFHFKRDEAVFDANVRRVMSRLMGFEDDDSAREYARSLIPVGWSSEWNYAILDLGAIVCRWKPACSVCPLSSMCATAHGKAKHA